MQDNNILYKIELNNEQYELLKNSIKEVYDKISKMNDNELQEYLKVLNLEQNLNFEKQIKNKIYKVNTYFNKDSEYTILQSLFEIFKK